MSLLRPIIEDDQGNRVRLASMLAAGSPSRSRGLSTFIWLPLIAVVTALLLAILFIVVLDAGSGPLPWAVALACGLFAAAVVSALELDWWRDNGRGYLKDRKRCAACAYDLADVATDRFGNTICPECGASWKLPGKPPQR